MRAFPQHPVGFGANFGAASGRPETQLRACQNETEDTGRSVCLRRGRGSMEDINSTEGKGVGRSEWVFGKRVGFAHSLTRDPQGVGF